MIGGKLNGLDLFSGIGGIGLALSDWVRTVAYCEQDRYAQGVLLSRMQSGDIDRAPIWDDVRILRGEYLPEIDIIFGGFPCQDISVAGNGVGLGGERSGLFFEIVRLAEEIRPKFIFIENVPAIRTRGLNRVGEELARIGYDCRWDVVSAAEVGAPHLRKRWFLLAYSSSERSGNESRRGSRKDGKSASEFIDDGKEESVAHSKCKRLEGIAERETQSVFTSEGSSASNDSDSNLSRLERQRKKSCGDGAEFSNLGDDSWWITEPDVGRVVNGLPMRVDRIKCLGNSVVPKQVKEAFERLMGMQQ